MNEKISGVAFRDFYKELLSNEINENGLKPAIIFGMVGDNPASKVYVRNKIKLAKEIGIEVCEVVVPETTSSLELKNELLGAIVHYRKNFQVSLMIQLPVPEHIDLSFLNESPFKELDIEGMTESHIAELFTSKGDDSHVFAPCTARGIINLLDFSLIPIEGSHVAVIGRSDIVGNPVCKLLTNRNATVTQIHSRTPEALAKSICKQADIVILAAGIPKGFDSSYFKDNSVIIDVGINHDENGKLCGDAHIDDILAHYENIKYTPVPGGVGPVTVSELMNSAVMKALFEKISTPS